MNTWQCWFQQNRPEQPIYTTELNLSSGCLNTNVSAAGAAIDKMVVIKPIKGKLFVGGDEPVDPRGTVGYEVVDTDENKVIFSKKGEDLQSIEKEADGRSAAQRPGSEAAADDRRLSENRRRLDEYGRRSWRPPEFNAR